MNSESREKIVEFDRYCLTCLSKDKKEDEDPCEECLANSTNLDSHKPIHYIYNGPA